MSSRLRASGFRPRRVPWLALLLVLVGASVARAQDTTFRVQYGVKVSPDTVTVGDPLRVVVRVRAPMGAEIEFPKDPDTTGTLQPRDPRSIRTAPDTAALDQSATYTLSAWDVDSQTVALGEVLVRLDGEERRVPLGRIHVFVKRVLPADTTRHVPKPPRALIEPATWPWWLLALLAAAIVVGLLLWWAHRLRQKREEAPTEDPFAYARREFARIEGLRLPEAGEPGRHVALMVDVLRDYLAARVPGALRSATSFELVSALRGRRVVPRDRLARLLSEADLIKFARSPVSRDHAYELGRDAAALVEEAQAQLVAEEAAARERASQAQAREGAKVA
ncbi:MAG TPA: hypothetical protein VEA99_19940 [Gemmatimonadaceae bacterium]|nr:hypothetical protein [Gemmatimonadaceae bacterium]